MTCKLSLSKLHFKTYPSISPSLPSVSQAGKTIFITGGGRGIGKNLASSFAASGASQIIIIGRDGASLRETTTSLSPAFPQCRFQSYILDITDANAVHQVFSTATTTFGKIDILLNNAGFLPSAVELQDADSMEWWRTFEVNVRGTMNVIQTFSALHPKTESEEGQGPVIINLTSASAYAFTFPGLSAYAASKMAMIRMTEVLQVERPDFRIVNVHPGAVATEMWKKAGGDEVGIPLNDDQLVGDFAVWLCSSDAVFLQGRVVEANWDVDQLKAQQSIIQEQNLLTIGLAGYPFDAESWPATVQKSQDEGL